MVAFRRAGPRRRCCGKCWRASGRSRSCAPSRPRAKGGQAMSPKASGARRSIRRHILTALAVVILLAGGLGGWAMTTELAGAVVASGSLVVDTNVKKVQHPTGGVVGELRVHDGDRVEAGDIVI